MPLGSVTKWAVILPVEKQNLLQNPSGERGTFGWGTYQSSGGGTVGTTSDMQQFGAWAGSCAPTGAAGQGGARLGTYTGESGSAYTASIYIWGGVGSQYALGVRTNDESTTIGATSLTTGGTWHRYSVAFTENSNTNRVVLITKSAAGNDAFYFDGAMVEKGSLTTYIDGDQDGCYWLGLPHQSQSVRSGTYRGGGSIVALADLGLRPDDTPGIGMPPQEVTSQSYALLPGAEYQRSRAAERPFTLTFKPILGTTLQDLHITRRTLINAIKPDLLDPQQPVRLWYTGGQGTVQIDAVYQAGLEFNATNGPMAEDGAIRFIAHDPYWEATTQEGTALAPRVSLGSANFIISRDPLGRWGTMGPSGSSVNDSVFALAVSPSGTLFVAGQFTTAAGTQAPRIAMWHPSTGLWGTLQGGTINNTARALAFSPAGTLYLAGDLTLAGGTAAQRIAQWNGAYGTLTGGSVDNVVRALAFSGFGTLFVGGNFQTAGGTAAGSIAQWANGVWGTLGPGTLNSRVDALAIDSSNRLYAGGLFTTAGGTASTNCIAVWLGSWGTMAGGVTAGQTSGASQVTAIAVAPDQQIYIGGHFGSAGGGSAQHIAQWNGYQWFSLANGFGTGATNLTSSIIAALMVDPQTGQLLVGAQQAGTTASGVLLPDQQAIWNSYAWLPMDVNLSGVAYTSAFARGFDGTTYVGGLFSGTAQAAAVAQVVNTGMAEAYPTVKVRNTGAGTARVFQVANTLTGDAIYFNNLFLQAAEEVTLTTEPGNRTFTSSFQGNLFGRMVPGSNIAGFRLMPGTNYISLFCDSGSVAASIFWQPRSDSVDGGTIV